MLFMGKLTISMAIFNSYVLTSPEGSSQPSTVGLPERLPPRFSCQAASAKWLELAAEEMKPGSSGDDMDTILKDSYDGK